MIVLGLVLLLLGVLLKISILTTIGIVLLVVGLVLLLLGSSGRAVGGRRDDGTTGRRHYFYVPPRRRQSAPDGAGGLDVGVAVEDVVGVVGRLDRGQPPVLRVAVAGPHPVLLHLGHRVDVGADVGRVRP